MGAVKPYLGHGTLEALLEDMRTYRYLEFYYKNLKYHIEIYSEDDVSIQIVDDQDIMDQDEIFYPSIMDLLNTYVVLDGTPILEILKNSNVDQKTWL